MRFDLHVRAAVRDQLQDLATRMSAWEGDVTFAQREVEQIKESIGVFRHATTAGQLLIGGVDGSGDFPALTYADSFVYLTVAHATLYASDANSGLREVPTRNAPIIDFCWMPEDEIKRREGLDASFAAIVGQSIRDVIDQSDYRTLKSAHSRRPQTVDALFDSLVRPHASDSGNIAIQLRSVAEASAALSLIRSQEKPNYVLLDTTFSLPFVTRVDLSLFQEHVKRLCCVEARERGIGFFALSKSHGLPAIEHIERLAADVTKSGPRVAEHWYLRIPNQLRDGWSLSLVEQRSVPPPGAVSYLVRFHRNVPVMRLDMDEAHWDKFVKGSTDEETWANEQRIFEDLDYSSHDQRCYGYPYPIKAGHDRASLTKPERVALRKMIIDAAVLVGMKRSLFRSASAATGHE